MKPEENGPPVEEYSSEDIKEFWFEFSSGEPFRYQVCGVSKPLNRGVYAYETDAVVVKIAKPPSSPAKVILASKAQEIGNYLYIPGLNLAQEQNTPFVPMATGVDGCRIVAMSAACVIHGCQSLPGTSGAPIFSVKSDGSIDLALIGIHIGGAAPSAALPQVCKPPQPYKIDNSPNFGIFDSAFTELINGGKP
jgi:hypothetical protein